FLSRAKGRGRFCDCIRVVTRLCVSHSRCPLRELVASLLSLAHYTNCDLRCLLRSLAARLRLGCLCSNWVDRAHWLSREECHSDRRVCEGRIGEGSRFDRGCTRRRTFALASNSDDFVCIHLRLS